MPLLLLFLLTAASPRPFHIAKMTDHAASVFDERTIRTLPGGLKQIDETAIFAKGTPFGSRVMHVSTTPVTFDCAKSRSYDGITTYMTVDAQVLVVDREADRTGQWDDLPAGSPGWRTRAWLCEGKPAPDAVPPVATLREAETVYFNRIGKPGELGKH